jgi:hypothetical protein
MESMMQRPERWQAPSRSEAQGTPLSFKPSSRASSKGAQSLLSSQLGSSLQASAAPRSQGANHTALARAPNRDRCCRMPSAEQEPFQRDFRDLLAARAAPVSSNGNSSEGKGLG